MTINVWPLDAVSSAPDYTARMVRQTLGALAGGHTTARPLGARSAVMAGVGVCASITGTTYTITPHSGVLDVESTAVAGPYFYAIDANITGSTAAPHATLPRVDLISVTLSDPSEDPSSVPGAALTYTTGAANLAPLQPATPALSLPLAIVSVPASGGGNPSITWIAERTVAVGGVLPITGTQSPPAVADMYAGQIVYFPSGSISGPLWFCDGAKLIPLTQGTFQAYTIAVGTVSVTGNVTFDSSYSSVPIVTATVDANYSHAMSIDTITTTGFHYRVFRSDSVNASTNQAASFKWIAIP